jgi:hypothetical protein
VHVLAANITDLEVFNLMKQKVVLRRAGASLSLIQLSCTTPGSPIPSPWLTHPDVPNLFLCHRQLHLPCFHSIH